ncbi:hypothetical protein ACHAWU_006236 [Discostella pseudostelligera]|uniref:Adaptor protein ClpS core domain-containing protein n=1 Tax=Discostella pseudostelligera TaxID=259834 RepID=A0ABD3MPC3_9STRA
MMVQSLKLLRFAAAAAAAAAIISGATAFTLTTSSSASLGINSRPISPFTTSSLQASTSSSPFNSFSSSALLERSPTTIEKTDRDHLHDTNHEKSHDGEYLLRIYNDNINTREYVAVCLVQVVGLCESRAFYTMQQAHQNGIAKVGEYIQEVAECYEEQLTEKGIVCDVISAGGK